MSTKKRVGIIAVASVLALVMTMSVSSQAAQTQCGQSCGKAAASSIDDRGTRNVAWLGGGAGTMRSGR